MNEYQDARDLTTRDKYWSSESSSNNKLKVMLQGTKYLTLKHEKITFLSVDFICRRNSIQRI